MVYLWILIDEPNKQNNADGYVIGFPSHHTTKKAGGNEIGWMAKMRWGEAKKRQFIFTSDKRQMQKNGGKAKMFLYEFYSM